MKVIDADAHMVEPADLWDRYVEKKYHDRVPKVSFMHGMFMVYEPDGVIIPLGDPQPRPSQKETEILEDKYGDAYKKWWSADVRLSDMDRYGWTIQVLLPTGNNGNFAYRAALKDSEVGAAMCRAYNNWAADYCSADSKRLKFVALVPGTDVEEMVKETTRAVTELGAVSIRVPYLPDGKWLHSPEYDPLWNLCQEIDAPIAAHGEYLQRRFQPFASLTGDKTTSLQLALHGLNHALGFPADNMTTLGQFIFTGILERFPRLRLAVLESNAGWLPFWLDRMDNHTHGRNAVVGTAEYLKMLPSEYFLRQCFIACDSDETTLPETVKRLAGNNLIWNTDYPHPDAVPPELALPEMLEQPISEQDKEKILWDNPVKLFGSRILS